MTQPTTVFPVAHSVLDAAALLAEIVVQYDIGKPIDCVLLRSWINEVYSLKTSQGQFILKVFRHAWRTPDEVAYEVELMQHLARQGLRVEPPVLTRNQTAIQVVAAPEGPRAVVLYPLLVGKPPLPPSETIYNQVGQAIAHMHQALDSFVPTYPRRMLDINYLAHEPLAWLEPHLKNRPADLQFLHALVQRVQTRLETLQQTGSLSWGAIHGDATLDNLLLVDDQQIGIYDFDQSGLGWRAYELQGTYAWSWEIKRPSFWAALRDGYTSVQQLSDADIAAMPCFPVLNRLWCMGFESHVIAQNRGRWIVSSDYFDERLAGLRNWAAAHPELRVE